MCWYFQAKAYQPAIAGTSKSNLCTAFLQRLCTKKHSKITLAGFEIKFYGGSLPTELSELSKIWNFRGASVQGRARARQTQKKGRRHSGREAATIFFPKSKKKKPARRQEARQAPTTSKRNSATKRAPEERNAHPQGHTQTTKFQTNATKTRETTPPPPRPTRDRRASETSTHKGEAESNKHEKEGRQQRRQRRSERERAHTRREKPATRRSSRATTTRNTAKEENKNDTPSRGTRGNDEANKTTREGKRRQNQRHHPQADTRSNHTPQRASERKKETTGEPADTTPHSEDEARERAETHTGKKRRDATAEHASRTRRTNDDAETGQRGDPRATDTGDGQNRQTTDERERGTARSKTKPPEAPRARSGRNIYISRERWPPTHTPFGRPGTHHHKQNLSSISIPWHVTSTNHDWACTNLTMITWMWKTTAWTKWSIFYCECDLNLYTHDKSYDDAKKKRDKVGLHSVTLFNCLLRRTWTEATMMTCTRLKSVSFIFWTEQKCRETFAMCDDVMINDEMWVICTIDTQRR